MKHGAAQFRQNRVKEQWNNYAYYKVRIFIVHIYYLKILYQSILAKRLEPSIVRRPVQTVWTLELPLYDSLGSSVW